MKTKINFKILISLWIMLLVVVLNMNTVNAATEVEELYNKIPVEINVDSTVWEEISNIIENEYILDTTKIKEKIDLPEGYTLHIIFENANCLDQGTAYITYNDKTVGNPKYLTVHYKDENQKTTSNEELATKLIENMQTAKFTYSYDGILNDENLSGAILKDTQEELIKSIKTKLNASSNVEIKAIQSFDGGDNTVIHYVGLFIDKVYYGSAIVMQEVVKEQEEINKSVSVTDNTTNIKLETDTTVVPENTVLEATEVKEQKIINVVKESLKEVSSKFVTYDINLLSNGTKVQPNGKVKISIPVPTGFDTSKLVVYRVADNGDKTEYKVAVEGKYATFETDHFSTYVLAEKEANNQQQTTATPTTTETQNKGEKDNTPKTGTTNIIGYVGILTVISAVGIIAFRKKQNSIL